MDKKEKVFDKLKELRLKYERAEKIMKSFQMQMENCFNELDWHNDKEMILEICAHLPQSYLRFRMYESYYDLQEKENEADINTESSSLQEGGGDNV